MPNLSSNRILSPYEQTHLARFGKTNIPLADYGEMPVEYITGKVEFCGHVFQVNQQTLIPRVESEQLVELAVNQLIQNNHVTPLTIIDVGTGSGALGLSVYLGLAEERPDIDLWLTDVSDSALAVAKQNAHHLLSQKQLTHVHFVKSDLLESIPVEITFDVVIANLPYIPSQRIQALDSSVKDFEPTLALDGGPEGLTLIQRMLSQVTNRLKPSGQVLLEIDHTHALTEITQGTFFTGQLVADIYGQNRFAILHPNTLHLKNG